MALNIVIGTAASGKTHFIKEYFPRCEHFSIGEYQNKLKEELGNQKYLEVHLYRDLLIKANEQIKEDVLNAVREGKEVVMEHTLYKAKRRILYMEAFREVTDEPISIYVMQPSDERLAKNIALTESLDADDIEWLKKEAETIEMPNIAEGYSKIYVVVDGKVEERIETLDEELISRAKSELEDEEKKEKEAEEKTRKHEEFLNELEKKGFWHYCEVCGKKEFLTPEEAYSQGWDYPPKMGFYGVISPRKCGSCGIEKTLYWKIVLEKKKMEDLTEEEEKTLARIVMEPQSLLKEEKSGKK